MDGSFGRAGTAGQARTKVFSTPEQAVVDADRLVAEKQGKGYREAA